VYNRGLFKRCLGYVIGDRRRPNATIWVDYDEA
jgi:hypothetical protein